MRATKLILVLAVALMSLPGLAGAATPDSRRVEGRLPDDSPLVSLAQPRGTVLVGLIPWIGTAVLAVAAAISAGAPLLSRFGRAPAVVAPSTSHV